MTPSRTPIVRVRLDPADADLAGAELFELGASGIEERDATTLERAEPGCVELIAHFGGEAEAAAARSALEGRYDAALEHIEGEDWRERWKEFFHPTRVGVRLVVRPPWEPFDAAPGDVVITIDPGQAFGTGTHETTRLVLGELERIGCRGSVLDVGCGSGILGIAAMLLGADRAVAVDVDPLAIRAAHDNAAANGVTLDASVTPLASLPGRHELVVANIRSPILIPMAPLLSERTGGRLVLSGLLVEEEDEVRAVFDARLELDRRSAEGEWLALTYRARP